MNLFEFAYGEERVLLNPKPASVSLSVADREVYAFDLEGRPFSFWINDQTFVWTLDSRVVQKWRDAEVPHQKQIREVDATQRRGLLERVRVRLTDLRQALLDGRLECVHSAELPGADARESDFSQTPLPAAGEI